nr:NUDIX domain-containing protein [Roseovarius sp. W115]
MGLSASGLPSGGPDVTCRFFLTGALARSDVLSHLLGDTEQDLRPFSLAGYASGAGAFTVIPGLVPALDATTDGQILTCPVEHAKRLRFLAQSFKLAPSDCAVEGEETTIFLVASVENPTLVKAWELTQLPMLLHAIEEIMSYYGRHDVSEVAARMPMILARAHSRVAALQTAPSAIRTALSSENVEVGAERATHEGYFLTRSYRLRHPTFDGGQSEDVVREVFVATDAAIVLPYDPVRDRVLLVEQFRMGPFGRADPLPWVLEPVAGRVDPGEAPETTARRECVEEAGLDLHTLKHVSSHYCSPGCSTEVFHCYVGLCDLPDMAQGQGGLETEHEDIRTHVLSFEDALNLTRTGEANIGPLVLLLLWLERERPRLRSIG